MSYARNVRRLTKKKLRGNMAEKRYFKILPDITIMELNGKKAMVDKENEELVCSHEEFIHARTTDPAFAGADPNAEPPKPPGWSMRSVVSAETVRALVRGKKPGDLIEIDEDDWERLKRATEKGDYSPLVAGSLIPFMREICDAGVTKPKESPSKSDADPVKLDEPEKLGAEHDVKP